MSSNVNNKLFIKKIGKIVGIGVLVTSIVSISVFGYQEYTTTKPKDIPPHIIVAYTADPDVTDDGQIKLGYPEHRFSVTCSDTVTNQCVLEVENGKKSITKIFPYVKQEWFTPAANNRPWHTLDVIYTLPSFNGNKDLRFGTDLKANKHLVEVMQQNGWVGQ